MFLTIMRLMRRWRKRLLLQVIVNTTLFCTLLVEGSVLFYCLSLFTQIHFPLFDDDKDQSNFVLLEHQFPLLIKLNPYPRSFWSKVLEVPKFYNSLNGSLSRTDC